MTADLTLEDHIDEWRSSEAVQFDVRDGVDCLQNVEINEIIIDEDFESK
jgi:hypothetical protein